MEISSALLVAIMFVMILSLGIAAILTFLAQVVEPRSQPKPDAIHTSWVVLLLLAHFNLFWYTVDIVSVQEWAFAGFLFIATGPTLLFFATNVMLPGNAGADADDMRAQYFAVRQRFFLLLAGLQLWVIGVDYYLGRGFTGAGAFNAAMMALAVVLAFSMRPRLHAAGIVTAWALSLGATLLRGLGLIH